MNEAASHGEAAYRRSVTGERERQEPRLGLATTHELIRELAARADVAETVGEEWPGYWTAGSRADGGAAAEKQALLAYELLDLYDADGVHRSDDEHAQIEQRVRDAFGPDPRIA